MNKIVVSVPNIVDNAQGDEEINSLFCEKYNALYNSVSYNVNEMNTLLDEININVNDKCKHNLCNSATAAIRMLKPYETDGIETASSDILIHACPELYIH